MRYLIPLLAAAVLSGCATSVVTTQPSKVAPRPENTPSIRLSPSAVQPTVLTRKPNPIFGEKSAEVDQAFQSEFYKHESNSTSPDAATVTRVQMKFFAEPNIWRDTFPGIMSFFIWPLAYVKTSETYPYSVSYQAVTPDGQPWANSTIRGSVSGYRTGWYVARHDALAELWAKQREFVGEESARLVLNDIYRTRPAAPQARRPETSVRLDTPHIAFSPPATDWARPHLAVADLTPLTLSHNEAVTLSEKLRHALTASGYYRVVSRSDMNAVLNEHAFQRTASCDDTQCLVEMGRLLTATLIMGGSVGNVGDTYSLTIRLVSVETGEIEATASANVQGSPGKLLDTAESLAAEITMKFSKKVRDSQ